MCIRDRNKTEETITVQAIPSLSTDDTIYSAVNNILNAKDFGVAPGNEDNTTQLQTAADALSDQGGGILFLPPGSYQLLGTVSLKENVNLFGVSNEYGKNSVTTLKTPQDLYNDTCMVLLAGNNTCLLYTSRCV